MKIFRIALTARKETRLEDRGGDLQEPQSILLTFGMVGGVDIVHPMEEAHYPPTRELAQNTRHCP